MADERCARKEARTHRGAKRPLALAGLGIAALLACALALGARAPKPDALPELVCDAEDEGRELGRAQTADELGDPTLHQAAGGGTQPRRAYTVMVYMVGSNLESRLGAATDDLDEMVASGVDFGRANVVVCTGGARRWNSDISADQTSVLDLSRDEGDRLVAATDGTADMASPDMLASFVTFAENHYPADHYALILWDHGGGPLWGYGSDELYRGDTLTLPEMRQAMEQTPLARDGRKLDWVGFDACLMASLENADLWSPYADYLVASEEVEAGSGWDYAFLEELNRTTEAGALCKAAVDAYGSYYQEHASKTSNPDVTLSVMDLAQVDAVTKALDGLSEDLVPRIDAGSFAQVAQARSQAKAFGLAGVSGKGEGYDLVDLGDLCRQLDGLDASTAQALEEAVGQLVVCQTSNVEGASGVSIYFPGDNGKLFEQGSVLLGDVAPSKGYEALVKAYATHWLEGEGSAWRLLAPQVADGRVTLALTEDQASQATEVSYSILADAGSAGYEPILLNVGAELAADGMVSIPADPQVVTMATDGVASDVPCVCAQVDGTNEEGSLRCAVQLFAGMEFAQDFDTAQTTIITLATKAGSDEVTIKDISQDADGIASQAGKATVDVTRYKDVLYNLTSSFSPTDDPQTGERLPFAQWERSGTISASYGPIDEDLSFTRQPLSSFGDGAHYVQVVVTDANGTRHASALAKLPGADEKTAQVATPAGTLTFRLEEDHATLVSYEGKDQELIVPAQVEGLPVTELEGTGEVANATVTRLVVPQGVTTLGESACGRLTALERVDLPQGLKTIGYEAFAGCSDLTALEIPDSVTRIGRAAFAYTKLTRVKIPAALKDADPAAFANMGALTAFEQAGKGPTKVQDGVLFSADGTELLSYPAAHGKRYRVPKGTERIAYGAFAGANLTQVTLPRGLRTIDNYAFYGCGGLRGLKLPASLESVGTSAFDAMAFGTDLEDQPRLGTLRLGAKLAYVGPKAFAGLRLAGYEVSEDNDHLASVDGALTSKVGDVLLAVPLANLQLVTVPDGITTLDKTALAGVPTDADYLLPSSLYRIDEGIFPSTTTSGGDATFDEQQTVYACHIHCEKGSAAEAYAQRYGIPYDNQTDPKALTFDLVEEDVGGVTLSFRVYGDHATLVSGELAGPGGTAEDATDTLVIPDEVKSVPVTELDVSGYLEVPAGTMALGLPKGLERVRASCQGISLVGGIPANVRAFKIAADNQAFKVVDGVLFSKDGADLVAFPQARQGSYEVPAGTKKIAPAAFQRARLTSVSFPGGLEEVGAGAFFYASLEEATFAEGLTSVGDAAFYRCPLAMPTLPKSLAAIGDDAFAGLAGYEGLALPSGLTKLGDAAFDARTHDGGTPVAGPRELVIPKGVHDLDGSAFAGVGVGSFAVAGGSEDFKALDGLLLSADGRTLVACPGAAKGAVQVPEGVRELANFSFAGAAGVTDVYLPGSVQKIGSLAFDLEHERTVTFHGPAGSEAEHLVRGAGFAWQGEKAEL